MINITCYVQSGIIIFNIHCRIIMMITSIDHIRMIKNANVTLTQPCVWIYRVVARQPSLKLIQFYSFIHTNISVKYEQVHFDSTIQSTH